MIQHAIASGERPTPLPATGFGLVPNAIARSKLSFGAKALYAVLAGYADRTTRECFPSRETLGADLDWGGPTVTRLPLEPRKAGGVVIRRGGRGHPTRSRWADHPLSRLEVPAAASHEPLDRLC